MPASSTPESEEAWWGPRWSGWWGEGGRCWESGRPPLDSWETEACQGGSLTRDAMRLLAITDMKGPARSKHSAHVSFLSRGKMRSFLSPCKCSLQKQSLVLSAQCRETQNETSSLKAEEHSYLSRTVHLLRVAGKMLFQWTCLHSDKLTLMPKLFDCRNYKNTLKMHL